MDPLNNFSLYRKALEAAMGEASQSKDESCVVPFFSLLVKDIYFLHEGVSNKLVCTCVCTCVCACACV